LVCQDLDGDKCAKLHVLIAVLSAVGAKDAGDVTASLAKLFGQYWLDLGKFGWIWANLKRNLGKSD